MEPKYIRNFAIIAHIDHGKSTLADQIMRKTDTIRFKSEQAQILDDMKVEQDHGVTVRSKTVRNLYHAHNGHDYELNLIDTPGHVDFNYEVAKSLSASDGVILLVDATKGVQAQTIANYRIAKDNHLAIIPVINKVDNQNAQVALCEQQIYELDDDFLTRDILKISAKTGYHIDQVLESLVHDIPAPTGNLKAPLKALIFDSHYDTYQGVIAHVRILDGQIKTQDQLISMHQKTRFTPTEIGMFNPALYPLNELSVGDIGYLVTGLKNPQQISVGDTLTQVQNPTVQAIPGYKPVHSVVFAGIYPKDAEFKELKTALAKLQLNDSALAFTEHVSDSLGPGFRCGFLGMFHLQIVRERLANDFNLSVVVTTPNVNYRYQTVNSNQWTTINNPAELPDFSQLKAIAEPIQKIVIQTPGEFTNDIMALLTTYRGILTNLDNQDQLVQLTYQVPLAEIALHFFNQLKSISHGFATYDGKMLKYQSADIVKITIDVNYAPVDALTFLAHRSKATHLAQSIVHQLKYVIPRKLYPTPVQGSIEGRVVARVDVPPLRKNAAVSGDKKSISKKQALLHRQNINKRKSASEHIKLPPAVFDAILNIDATNDH
jgi:GTP-binding protein LepA